MDIFCLQELFFGDVQRQVYNAAKDLYPYVHTATDLTVDDSTSTTPACTPEENAQFVSCLIANGCSNLEVPATFLCFAT